MKNELEPFKERKLSAFEVMALRPSDVISFSVWDHEETKLFGIMRDEMMLRRKGESHESWEARCDEVRRWNRRRSQLMTAVFVMKVAEKYGPESEGVKMLVMSFGMALEWAQAKALPPEEMVKLLARGRGYDE